MNQYMPLAIKRDSCRVERERVGVNRLCRRIRTWLLARGKFGEPHGACDAQIAATQICTGCGFRGISHIPTYNMPTNGSQYFHERRFGEHYAIDHQGNRGHLMEHFPHPRSAPTIRHPQSLKLRHPNKSSTTVFGTHYSSRVSLHHTSQPDSGFSNNKQLASKCEKSPKHANDQNIRNKSLLQENYCLPHRHREHQQMNSREILDTRIVFGNRSTSHTQVCSLPNSSQLRRTVRSLPHNENHNHNITNGGNDQLTMRYARSFGVRKSTSDNGDSFLYYNKPSMPLKLLQNSDPSSFFEIESGVTSEQLEESPIPYNDIQATINSPHNPPFEAPIKNNQAKTLMQGFHNPNNVILPRADYFEDYMEERIARWRPGNSQFNVEDTMDGNHPYQKENFELEKKAAKIRPYNPFVTLRSWFNEKAAISDLENQAQDMNLRTINTNPNYFNAEDLGSQIPEIAQRINAIKFRINSSNSIIPKPFKTGDFQSSIVAKVARNSYTHQEPSPIEGPSYTPKALPFNEFDLNFETKGCISGHKVEQDSNAIVDSMDEDVRDLLDGSDNFLFDCFRSLWYVCSSTRNACFKRT